MIFRTRQVYFIGKNTVHDFQYTSHFTVPREFSEVPKVTAELRFGRGENAKLGIITAAFYSFSNSVIGGTE